VLNWTLVPPPETLEGACSLDAYAVREDNGAVTFPRITVRPDQMGGVAWAWRDRRTANRKTP
jgi:hypothetical protein